MQGSGPLKVLQHKLEESFCNPNPHMQGKNMNINMALKLSSLPGFEAFWVILCPDVCSYFCLVCGGGGVTCAFLKHKLEGHCNTNGRCIAAPLFEK